MESTLQVRELEWFLVTLHEVAEQAAMEPQRVHSHLLGLRAMHHDFDSGAMGACRPSYTGCNSKATWRVS